jgi:hypothetical protein
MEVIKDIELNYGVPEYYGHIYPQQSYDAHLQVITKCGEIFRDYHMQAGLLGSQIDAFVKFPFDSIIADIHQSKLHALYFPKDEMMESCRESKGMLEFWQNLKYKMPEKKLYKIQIKMEISNLDDPDRKLVFEPFQPQLVSGLLDRFLCDLYLVANLSKPGVLDFAKLEFGERNPLSKLSGLEWESINPKIVKTLDVEQVYRWYKRIVTYSTPFPTTQAEKVLGSIIRFNRRFSLWDDPQPIVNIYLINAIEVLYGSLTGSVLKKRLSLIFKDVISDELKESIEALSKWRNKLVHGSLEFPYPIPGSTKDHRQKYAKPYYESREVGFGLVIGSLQKLIEENASGFQFEENWKFIPV